MKMTGTDNADVEKCGESKVEGEERWRTVECLRGRLLAERMASKNAREEADQLGIRLVEMERLLEQEEKSRTKAEKKLKLVMKKLEIVGKYEELNERSQVIETSPTNIKIEEVISRSECNAKLENNITLQQYGKMKCASDLICNSQISKMLQDSSSNTSM